MANSPLAQLTDLLEEGRPALLTELNMVEVLFDPLPPRDCQPPCLNVVSQPRPPQADCGIPSS